jgi:pyruvate dehydrogenase (quinone)
MPPKATFEQAHQFALFTLKAVMDGRATELIDLARTNLRV